MSPPTTEVWVAVGDSEAAGRGDVGDLSVVLPGYPPASGLRMLRTSETWRALAEPCADGAVPSVGVGPMGMFGYLRSLAIGREVAIVNCAIGGLKSSQWLPSSDPASPYAKCLARALPALSQDGAYLGGYLQYDGANDAVEAVCTWGANWEATHAALRAAIGQAPLVYTRLPAFVPTDMSYPTWSDVRAQQIAFATSGRTMVQAPEGPWREAYKLHLTTAGNYAVAQAYLQVV